MQLSEIWPKSSLILRTLLLVVQPALAEVEGAPTTLPLSRVRPRARLVRGHSKGARGSASVHDVRGRRPCSARTSPLQTPTFPPFPSDPLLDFGPVEHAEVHLVLPFRWRLERIAGPATLAATPRPSSRTCLSAGLAPPSECRRRTNGTAVTTLACAAARGALEGAWATCKRLAACVVVTERKPPRGGTVL